MSRFDKYVIECRKPDGSLDFSGQRPDQIFGMRAITGITENEMADVVFRYKPDAVLLGTNISLWPQNIDERWIARKKTW